MIRELPPIDLNNLFKWAVVKIEEMGYNIHIHLVKGRRRKVVISNAFTTFLATNDTLEDALFWAIKKVFSKGMR